LYAHDWCPSVGGIQTVTLSLARGLAAWGESHAGQAIEVTVVTQTPADGMNDASLPFRVVRRPSNRELFERIRTADVVHVANPAFIPLLLGWLLRKPVVLEHDGYQSICPNGLLVYGPDRSVCPGHFMARRYGKCLRCNSASLGWAKSLHVLFFTFPRRWLARRMTCNVAPSDHIGRRVALPRTQTIYHGVPRTPALPAEHSDGGSGPTTRFAYVGRLVLEKGVPILLRASSKLSQEGFSFLLRIIGDGSERSNLEKMTDELGLRGRTEFAGSVSSELMPEKLADVAAVVMPSVCEDVAPLAASELLMQGSLVIASDIGGLGEIVDGVGLKFPAGDADGLAACMRQVLEDPDSVRELRERAHRRGAEVFNEESMVENHAILYWKLMELPRKPTPSEDRLSG
jgi:glycosyltransferase involved in cell wall biosynthesis